MSQRTALTRHRNAPAFLAAHDQGVAQRDGAVTVEVDQERAREVRDAPCDQPLVPVALEHGIDSRATRMRFARRRPSRRRRPRATSCPANDVSPASAAGPYDMTRLRDRRLVLESANSFLERCERIGFHVSATPPNRSWSARGRRTAVAPRRLPQRSAHQRREGLGRRERIVVEIDHGRVLRIALRRTGAASTCATCRTSRPRRHPASRARPGSARHAATGATTRRPPPTGSSTITTTPRCGRNGTTSGEIWARGDEYQCNSAGMRSCKKGRTSGNRAHLGEAGAELHEVVMGLLHRITDEVVHDVPDVLADARSRRCGGRGTRRRRCNAARTGCPAIGTAPPCGRGGASAGSCRRRPAVPGGVMLKNAALTLIMVRPFCRQRVWPATHLDLAS